MLGEVGLGDRGWMGDRQIVVCNPAEELAAINAVTTDGQDTPVLAGQLREELLQGLLENVICSFHGFTVANPAVSGQTPDPAKSGSDNTGFCPLYGTAIPCVNGENGGAWYAEPPLSEPSLGLFGMPL